jgi:hypothetical protein
MISQWGGLVGPADATSTMIVGVHRVADETLRLHEYSPGFDPERFAAHERFFVEDVGAWVRSRFALTLSAARTAVCGVSAWREEFPLSGQIANCKNQEPTLELFQPAVDGGAESSLMVSSTGPSSGRPSWVFR